MTQQPPTATEPHSPADGIPPALLDQVADAIWHECRAGHEAAAGTVWQRYARAAITAMRSASTVGDSLPRDWRAVEVHPGTPYVDEPSVMVPPGVYLAGGFSDDPEDGADLILRVEQALDVDDRWSHLSLAKAVADRLNRGAR